MSEPGQIFVDPELLELAQTLPKIPPDDPRVEKSLRGESVTHDRFLNNFWMIWNKVLGVSPFDPDDPHDRAELAPLLEWSEWPVFSEQNAKLLEELKSALVDYKPVSKLDRGYVDLLNEGQLSGRFEEYKAAANQLHEATGHPIGMTGSVLYAWDRINPLLEEVARKLAESGFDPVTLSR